MGRALKLSLLLFAIAAVTAASAFYGYTSEIARQEKEHVLVSGAER